jgi:hypothetical protein
MSRRHGKMVGAWVLRIEMLEVVHFPAMIGVGSDHAVGS